MLWCAGLYPMHSKATRVQEDSQPAEQQSVTKRPLPPEFESNVDDENQKTIQAIVEVHN